MSRLMINTVDAHGRSVQLAAGYDPGTHVYFLDMYDLRDEDADPLYESMFEHPAGKSTYGLTELAADVDRLLGRSVPVLLEAVRISPSGQFIKHLGTH